MKRAAIIAATVFWIPAAWIAASSALYCVMARKWDLFVFPYAQILDVWQWRNSNWLLMLIVWASVAIPGLLLGLIGVLWWRYRWPSRPLYGAAKFADERAMRNGGMRLDKSPFSL